MRTQTKSLGAAPTNTEAVTKQLSKGLTKFERTPELAFTRRRGDAHSGLGKRACSDGRI